MTAFDLAATILTALQPPAKILPSQWAERHIVLPRESNARPGKLRLATAQRQIMDAAVEPDVRVLVLKCATQIGKTLAVNAIMGWSMDGESGPMLLVRPDDSDAKNYVRQNLDPIIAATPRLRSIVGKGPKGLDSTEHKSFPGGSLAIVSSWKAAALAGKAIRVLICDELDRFAAVVAGGEGEPLTLARRRLQTYRHNSLLILASSPTLKGSSRITAEHAMGDCREFFVPCPACGDMDDITADRLHIENDDATTARLQCLACGHKADEHERKGMIAAGTFRATAIGALGVASFHLPELASEFSSLEEVATATLGAKTLEARKVLQNTTWGLEYEPTAEIELDASDLRSRAVLVEAPYAADIAFITAGVDVQSNRVEVTFLAHTGKRRIVLNHFKIMGDTSGAAVWNELDARLASTFSLKDGRTIGLSGTLIDAGFATQSVVDAVVRMRARGKKVWPSFGRAGWDRPAVKAGARIRDAVRGYTLGVDNLKHSVSKALASPDLDLNPIALPDHLDAEVFAQYTAEVLQIKYVKGQARHVWVKVEDRNEALDCLVLAAACATIPGVKSAAKPIGTENKPSLAERYAALNSIGKEGTKYAH